MNNKQRAVTLDLVNIVFDKLPPPQAPGVDYSELRGRVHVGLPALRGAIGTLLAQKRIEATNGGLRNRKVFRRAEQGAQNGA